MYRRSWFVFRKCIRRITASWCWKYYYLQQQFNRANGKYAATIAQLDKLAEGLPDTKVTGEHIQMFVNEKQFYIQGKLPGYTEYITIDHKGELRTEHK